MAKAFQGLKWVPEEVNIQNIISRLFQADNNPTSFYELDQDTLLSLGTTPLPNGGCQYDIGGTSRLYYNSGTKIISEIDPDTGLSLNQITINTANTQVTCVGGIANRLYCASRFSTKDFSELDQNTLLIIANTTGVPDQIYGCGGTIDRLYYASEATTSIYEINPNTRIQISSATTPGSDISGLGGTDDRLFTLDATTNLNYELDLDTKLQINSAVKIGSNERGIGGIKLIGPLQQKVIIQKATLAGNTFNLNEPLLDTKPQ